MKLINREALVKSVKEGLRVVLLAIIPLLIIQVQEGVVDPRALYAVGTIALLRFVDKYLHEFGKLEDRDVLVKGLTRF